MKGEILNRQGIGVSNCTIKIALLKNDIIVGYFNTGEKNSFSLNFNLPEGDSININISHLGYETKNIVRSNQINQKILLVSAVLDIKSQELKTVEIKAPSIWVHGDTTFHKVDDFKEGNEKKLKDLLVKIPGFEIDENGQLLYNKLPVEKVTIDGQEMFSDKLELMINNFPIHVLNTIDAVQNQSEQKLLKGLNGEKKVFLNLGLKKDIKLKAAFGDGEIGAGNESRYSITPVVFSIYGKIKAGFIGNWNSIGNGISWKQENELKKDAERKTAPLLMYNNPLQLINNFENRWYIKNQQWDNRLQINSTPGKKLKSQTEIAYIKDKQNQNTFYNSSLYEGTSYQARIDSNMNIYRPEFLNLRQFLTFSLDSTKELKLEANMYLDFSNSAQNSIYNGFGIQNKLNRTLNNNWESLSLKTDYVQRVTNNKATSLFLYLNQQNLNQNGQGMSRDFASLFNAPNPDYSFLTHRLRNKTQQINAGWKQLIKSKDNLITNFGITFGYLNVSLKNQTELNDSLHLSPPVFPLANDNQGPTQIYNLTGNLTKSFKFLLKNAFFLNADVGMVAVESRDLRVPNFTNLTGKIDLNHEHNLLKKLFTGRFNASYNQAMPTPNEAYGNYYPSTITTFHRSVNIEVPQKKLEIYYSLAHFSINNGIMSHLYINWNRKFTNKVGINNYKGIINYYTDSLTYNNTEALSFSGASQIPSLFLNALFNFNTSYSAGRSLILNGGEIVSLPYHIYNIHFSFKKNWNRKYFIRLNSQYNATTFKFPDVLKGNASNKVVNLRSTFYQRWVMNSQMNLASNISLYNNNLFSSNKAVFVFADLEWTYQIKKKPIFISAKADNLTNQKNFYNFQNYGLIQSFSTMPLIKRNLYLSVKYSF